MLWSGKKTFNHLKIVLYCFRNRLRVHTYDVTKCKYVASRAGPLISSDHFPGMRNFRGTAEFRGIIFSSNMGKVIPIQADRLTLGNVLKLNFS